MEAETRKYFEDRDIEVRKYFDDKFNVLSSDMKEVKTDIKSMTKEVLCQSEKIAECKKDISYLGTEVIRQKNENEKVFDRIWEKNREQDDKIFGINKKVFWASGGIAIGAFALGIIVTIIGWMIK